MKYEAYATPVERVDVQRIRVFVDRHKDRAIASLSFLPYKDVKIRGVRYIVFDVDFLTGEVIDWPKGFEGDVELKSRGFGLSFCAVGPDGDIIGSLPWYSSPYLVGSDGVSFNDGTILFFVSTDGRIVGWDNPKSPKFNQSLFIERLDVPNMVRRVRIREVE